MTREKHKWLKPRGERTEVGHWDGPICKSDEGSVMGLEQRIGSGGCISVQLETG